MDWRSRSTRKLLGKVVTVQVDRPVGYLHGDILYPINYGFVPGLMGGDGEEQDAYILGVDTPLSDGELTARLAQAGIRVRALSEFYQEGTAQRGYLVVNYSGIQEEDLRKALKAIEGRMEP